MSGETKYVVIGYKVIPENDYIDKFIYRMRFFDSIYEAKKYFLDEVIRKCEENIILSEIEDLRDSGYSYMEILDKLYDLEETESFGFFIPTYIDLDYTGFINFVKENIEKETRKKCSEIHELYSFSNISENIEISGYINGTIIILFRVALS